MTVTPGATPEMPALTDEPSSTLMHASGTRNENTVPFSIRYKEAWGNFMLDCTWLGVQTCRDGAYVDTLKIQVVATFASKYAHV